MARIIRTMVAELIRPIARRVVRVLRCLACMAVALAGAACDRSGEPGAGVAAAGAEPAEYVGGAVCAGCHAEQAAAWRGSQHDLAMQEAGPETVLGDFDDAEFRYGEVTTRFFRRDGRYLVSTDGADGEIAEFEVAYTFGIEPLQQYLIELDRGRLQALGIAWDSRPASEGGQRWFHLYPDQAVDHTDPLHWTGSLQRWNTMCADCHSTHLIKDYDESADSFATHWSSIDVDCEACHGPGSIHAGDPTIPPRALASQERSWVFDPDAAIAHREPGVVPGELVVGGVGEAATCARCHSRRTQLGDRTAPGDPLLDGYRPELLIAGLYHADGQIQDEVYVYGSFLESAMAQAGVTCSDCHDPHSATTKAEGNALCGQCHLPSVFDRPAHHRHEPGSAGSECTACHMREETYMVVDPRRDHSFRVPRPDLSLSLGTPNACNDCHQDQSPDWAAARVAEWYPDGRWNEPHFGQALFAGRHWAADARAQLWALIDDAAEPAIARATAVELLTERLAPADTERLAGVLDRDEPLVQLAVIEAAAALAPDSRIGLIQHFLDDDRLLLRTAAARALLPVSERLSVRRQTDLGAAIDEYQEIQAFNSDRPEGVLNAATLALDQGRYDEAEALYREGIERYPYHPALYVNLGDLLRLVGRDGESEAVLESGLTAVPESAAIELALGFAIVRRGAPDEALAHFEAAAALAPDEPRYQYVRAIAENDVGKVDTALELLRETHDRFPGHGDTLYALATMLRDAGELEAARDFAAELVAVLPGDDGALSLLSELEQRL